MEPRHLGPLFNTVFLDCSVCFGSVMALSIQLLLSEDDIPGASLCGRSPANLKIDELRFWLKCRGDPSKGLKTKAQYIKR